MYNIKSSKVLVQVLLLKHLLVVFLSLLGLLRSCQAYLLVYWISLTYVVKVKVNGNVSGTWNEIVDDDDDEANDDDEENDFDDDGVGETR